jgi:hypothetical protein
MELTSVPFEYRNGEVRLAIDRDWESQMIVVRRTGPPADNRLADLKEKVRTYLESSDPTTLAAGAWFAGLHDWGFENQLVPLLNHSRWQVRRAAVEALGRRKAITHAAAVRQLISKETDRHVLGDSLVSLAELDPSSGKEIVRILLERKDDHWLLLQALRSLRKLPSTEVAKHIVGLEFAIHDAQPKVRSEAIRLLAEHDVERVWRELLGYRTSDPRYWAQALAEHARLLARYRMESDVPLSELLVILSVVHDLEGAAKLFTRLDEWIEKHPETIVPVAMRQLSPELSRRLFSRRAKLPAAASSLLPFVLEHTFGARLGTALERWESHLAESEKIGK